MEHIYHITRGTLRGNLLYPLNQLQALHPDLHAHEKAKYGGRDAALDFRIPHVDVLWNDTVHCAPLHPYYLFEALQHAGYPILFQWFCFQIPVDRLAGMDVMWYRNESFWINNAPEETVPVTAPEDEFEPFDPTRYREFTVVPERHMAYLRHRFAQRKRPLLFAQIPHILVAGPINVTGLVPFPWDIAPEEKP